jgi:hypothetical protein
MLKDDEYSVMVACFGDPLKPWKWEIYRNGEPLPARLRGDGYKSERTAKLGGNAALQDFLSGLAIEQLKNDW